MPARCDFAQPHLPACQKASACLRNSSAQDTTRMPRRVAPTLAADCRQEQIPAFHLAPLDSPHCCQLRLLLLKDKHPQGVLARGGALPACPQGVLAYPLILLPADKAPLVECVRLVPLLMQVC